MGSEAGWAGLHVSSQELMLDHAWVNVDALTGETSIVGRG
jgi:hypothetical protein